MLPTTRVRRGPMLRLAVSLATALTLVAPAGVAAAKPPPGEDPDPNCPTPVSCPAIKPLRFGAVGDSYWAGEGASRSGAYVPGPGGAEDWRHRSGLSPVHLAWMYLEMGRRPLIPSFAPTPTQLQLNWGPDTFTFNASSGAETQHLYYPQPDEDGGGAIRNQPQLDSIDPNSDIVFFGLGGNDAGFGSIMKTALKAYYSRVTEVNREPWERKQHDAVEIEIRRRMTQMGQVSTNVGRGISITRDVAPRAAIVVGLYPVGVRPSGNPDLEQIGGDTLDLLYPYAVEVNNAIRAAVARFKAANPGVVVHIFDPNTAGTGGTSVVAGHELGQPNSYFNGVKYRKDQMWQLNFFKGHQESFHPNELGAVAIGQALARFMAANFPTLFPSGPDIQHVPTNPQAAAPDPNLDRQVDEWARNNLDRLCEGAPADSICQYIGPNGDVVTPLDIWTKPIKLKPLPGAAVPGSPGDGAGGSSDPGFNPSTWISAGTSGTPTINIPWWAACLMTGWARTSYPSVSARVQGYEQPIQLTLDPIVLAPRDPCFLLHPEWWDD